MHQTFIILLGFFVLSWAIPDLLQYLLIAGGTFLLMGVLHFGFIRRYNVLRVLFGLTPRPAKEKRLEPAHV
jgi:hypothetical protein